ncbi:MAG: hypothetical protein NXH75_04270 [Halobacteriovoraceae bacterium]|nr:hypothetical protein [Halobacteriovoraceae bacterium]
MAKNKGIIVDIDGTLANVDHRLKFIHNSPKDWEAFHGSCEKDTPNDWCLDIIKALKVQGTSIVLLTGRGEEYREQTLSWLKNHNIPFDDLFMRGENDRRSDDLIKKEIYENKITPHYEISFVLEDRLSVVKMWREVGVTCLQCAWGDF